MNGMSAPSVAPAPVVLPCVALSGVDGQIGEESYHRITNQNDWVKLWRKHKGDQTGGEYDFHYDPLGLPSVDFNQVMVIALFHSPDDSWDGFQAESISENPEEIKIRFRLKFHQTLNGSEVRPFPNKPEACDDEVKDKNNGLARKPYGFFFIPKSNKMIIMERRYGYSDPKEDFRFPALK